MLKGYTLKTEHGQCAFMRGSFESAFTVKVKPSAY